MFLFCCSQPSTYRAKAKFFWDLLEFFLQEVPKGSLCIYLLSVAYFHWVIYCGFICHLPQRTRCAQSLYNMVLCDLPGAAPLSLVSWNHLFPSFTWSKAHGIIVIFWYVDLFLIVPDQLGLGWVLRWGAAPTKSQEHMCTFNSCILVLLTFSYPCLCFSFPPRTLSQNDTSTLRQSRNTCTHAHAHGI